MSNKYKFNDEDFVYAVANSTSIRGTLVKLGLNATGGSYRVFHNRTQRLNLDTSHFTGQGHNRGKKFSPKRSLEDYLSNTFPINSHKLKLRLISEGIFMKKCYQCNLSKWNEVDIPVELHHIDGNHSNNSLENLVILCPNCHALTSNHRAKNRSLARDSHAEGFPEFDHLQSEDFSSDDPETESVASANWARRASKIKFCLSCQRSIRISSSYCKNCLPRTTKITWPLPSEMEQLVWSIPSSVLAVKLGVSDKAIEKYCKKHNIDKPPRGYWIKLKHKIS